MLALTRGVERLRFNSLGAPSTLQSRAFEKSASHHFQSFRAGSLPIVPNVPIVPGPIAAIPTPCLYAASSVFTAPRWCQSSKERAAAGLHFAKGATSALNARKKGVGPFPSRSSPEKAGPNGTNGANGAAGNAEGVDLSASLGSRVRCGLRRGILSPVSHFLPSHCRSLVHVPTTGQGSLCRLDTLSISVGSVGFARCHEIALNGAACGISYPRASKPVWRYSAVLITEPLPMFRIGEWIIDITH